MRRVIFATFLMGAPQPLLLWMRLGRVGAFLLVPPLARPTTTIRTATALQCSAVVTRPDSFVQENDPNKKQSSRQPAAQPPPLAQPAVQLSEEDYLRRLEVQLEKLRQKDLLSPLLTKEVSFVHP